MSVTSLRRALEPHRTTGRWLFALCLAWALVPALSAFGMWDVAQGAADRARPLEQLGTMALCAPVAVSVAVLGNPSSWLLRVSRRSAVFVRSIVLAAVTAPSILVGAVVVQWLPAGVPLRHIAFLWLWLLAIGVLAVCWIGESVAGVIPPVLIALATLPNVVPWPANVVFNIDAGELLSEVAIVAALLAVAAYCLFGDATGRHETTPAM